VLTFVLATAISLLSSIQCAGMSPPHFRPGNDGSGASNLQVRLPIQLSKGGGYDHSEAGFGSPPYGGHSIEQNLYHTDDSLCSGAIDINKIGPTAVPFTLIVDRGDCTFVQKVRNAQRSGATAVIVADNVCQCEHDHICTLEKGTECQVRAPLMADDGSGGDVTIPAMLILKQDADEIKAVLEKGTSVRVEMVWSVPNPNDHVELDLWSMVTDPKSKIFQTMWKEAQMKLGDTISFTPHYYITDGLKANCRDQSHNNMCYTLCTNHGRYCAHDPDNDLDYGISGANVVEESLRRLCIWNIYGSNGSGPELFTYMREFMECDTDEDFMNEKCINGALSRVKIDKHKVNQCMTDSGGIEAPDVNKVLQHQLDELKANEVRATVVYVNGVQISGALNFDVVFKAVCAGYKEGTQPDICAKCADCTDTGVDSEYSCVVKDYCPDDSSLAGVVKDFTGNTVKFNDALIAPTPSGEPLPAPTAQSMAGQVLNLFKSVVACIIIAGVLVIFLFTNTRYLHIHDCRTQPEGCNGPQPDDYIELTQSCDCERIINAGLL